MALPLERWASMSYQERWNACADLTTVRPMGLGAPAYVTVTLLAGIPGGYQRGQQFALPPGEAAALISAGIAS